MDRLEQQLRATFADDHLDLPLRPDAPSRVHAGVRRRRRRRTIATVASVVVLLGGAVAAASFVTTRGGTDQIVPPTGGGQPTAKPPLPTPTQDELAWVATPYDYHRPPAFPGAVADPSVPWCLASQLTLSQSFQGAGGSWVGSVTVTNTSGATCALQGQPLVSMQTADGQPLVASHPEPFFVNAWVRLAPGRAAAASVSWQPEFCHEPGVGRVAVVLPHDGGTLTTAMHGSPRCDVDTVVPMSGHLDADGFLDRPGAPFTPMAGLQAQLDKVPASTLPGGVLHYRLQLQSIDAPSVTLDPCLPYRERLVDHATGAVLFEQDFFLNCGAPPLVVTNPQSLHSTYFDLQIDVPSSAPAGSYDLVWQSVLKPVTTISSDVVRVLPAAPPCRDGQLSASAGFAGAATGHYAQVVVFHNVSSTACTLRGYPGLALLDKSGHPMAPAPKRGGDFMFADPGPHTVVLAAHGGTASFSVGGSDYDQVNQRMCPTGTQMAVYAPETRTRLLVPVGFPVCSTGVDFSAVVAGSQGVRG